MEGKKVGKFDKKSGEIDFELVIVSRAKAGTWFTAI